jgi:hypothetical protein
VWLAASRIIERPPAEVFPFMATRSLPKPPKWIRRLPSSRRCPRAHGGRNDSSTRSYGQGPADRRQHGGHRVRAGLQLDRGVPVGPFTLHVRTTFAPVAPASTRLQPVMPAWYPLAVDRGCPLATVVARRWWRRRHALHTRPWCRELAFGCCGSGPLGVSLPSRVRALGYGRRRVRADPGGDLGSGPESEPCEDLFDM